MQDNNDNFYVSSDWEYITHSSSICVTDDDCVDFDFNEESGLFDSYDDDEEEEEEG